MERRHLPWDELFKRTTTGIHTYGHYDMRYRQSECELHRFPELFKCGHELSFEHAHCWTFARVRHKNINFKGVVQLLYECFGECEYIVPYLTGKNEEIELRGRQIYVNESFEVMRNRSLFEIREYLGIKHSGLGRDSKMLPSPYSGRLFKLEIQ